MIVGIFSSVVETIGIATAGAALGVAGGKAVAKRIKSTRVKPCSFVEDTPVLMCDGTLKSIVDVEIGDSVLARSKLTGEIECREVMNLSEPAERSIILVTLKSMDGTSELIATTENHPFFVEGFGWTRVDELVPGDLVPSATNGLLTVSALEWTNRIEYVYNFGVDEYHTYFVGEVGAWVHNCYTLLTDDAAKTLGQSAEEIAEVLAESGYTIRGIEQSTRGSKLGRKVLVEGGPEIGSRKISQVLVHPGNGHHGTGYVKISTGEGPFKIVGKGYKSLDEKGVKKYFIVGEE